MPRASHGMAKILIVEDSSTVQAYLARALSLHGHEVFRALNGEQGLVLARAIQPDVITMDCRMPLLGGAAAAEQLAQDVDLMHVPIIFVSSVDERGELKRVLTLPNIADYLLKPVNAETLIQRVDRLLLKLDKTPVNPAWDNIERRVRQIERWEHPSADRRARG